jgi:hypothetical protein
MGCLVKLGLLDRRPADPENRHLISRLTKSVKPPAEREA